MLAGQEAEAVAAPRPSVTVTGAVCRAHDLVDRISAAGSLAPQWPGCSSSCAGRLGPGGSAAGGVGRRPGRGTDPFAGGAAPAGCASPAEIGAGPAIVPAATGVGPAVVGSGVAGGVRSSWSVRVDPPG